ncbi:hypothetical protein TSEDIMI_500002 [Tenacibaculum sediminilitoris]
MKWNGSQTACEAFSYGEVEDYTVNIVSSARQDNIVDAERLGNEATQDLEIYPNPTIDFVNVKLSSLAEDTTFRIIDTRGRMVKSGVLDATNINVSKLKTGLYILEVNDGQKLLKTKFLKK